MPYVLFMFCVSRVGHPPSYIHDERKKVKHRDERGKPLKDVCDGLGLNRMRYEEERGIQGNTIIVKSPGIGKRPNQRRVKRKQNEPINE